MIIDFHTHCFPERIAPSAIEKLAYAAGGLEPRHDGTLVGLKKLNNETGVDIAVVLNIATNPKQMKNVNNFAAEINKEEGIIGFGSVHPDAPDALEELDRIKELGLKGVKFHPDYQGFFSDDPKMKPIYRKISELGLITSFHAGKDYGYKPPYHNMPVNMAGALKMLDGPVIAAHWGGVASFEEVMDKLCGLPLYFDTSFGYGQMARCEAMEIIEKHGVDNMLFGTDAPWMDAKMIKRMLDTLELSEDEISKIEYINAKKLLNL